ncbi:unnamed protein product [Symbiodinium sp. CCMP2592]|nr:unnamed protein product [Symbiodinium sp. CCMP2592]
MEVQQAVGVDVEVHVPKVIYAEVEKEFAAVTLQPREKVVEVPVMLREERLVEVPQVQSVPVVTQHLRPAVEFVEKPVALAEISVEEREQLQAQATVLIEEELLEIPQQQLVEVTRQELQPVLEEVVKEVPKYRVEYLEKVVEVQSQVLPQAPGTAGTAPHRRTGQVVSVSTIAALKAANDSPVRSRPFCSSGTRALCPNSTRELPQLRARTRDRIPFLPRLRPPLRDSDTVTQQQKAAHSAPQFSARPLRAVLGLPSAGCSDANAHV